MKYKLHSKETAPEKSKSLLDNSLKTFGMIPNLHALMAEAPALLEGYQVLHDLFQQTSFDKEELTVIWQTINVEHECHYCVPAHTAVAQMMAVDGAVTDALRSRSGMPTEKLQTLHLTTLALVRSRGSLSEEELTAFFAAGYGNRQLMEIILGLSQKVMSNYVNHLFDTPIDEPFQPYAWKA